MDHAGFDGLHNPLGVAMVCLGLFLTSAIIIFGSAMLKVAMAKDKAVRQSLKDSQKSKH